jgi:hypothetical protein
VRIVDGGISIPPSYIKNYFNVILVAVVAPSTYHIAEPSEFRYNEPCGVAVKAVATATILASTLSVPNRIY